MDEIQQEKPAARRGRRVTADGAADAPKTEKTSAESLAWKVGGVKAVKNEIAVRP